VFSFAVSSTVLGSTSVSQIDVGLVVGTELAQRIAHPDLIHDRYAQQIRLQRPRAVEIVVDLVHRLRRGDAVGQVERADGRIQMVGVAIPGAIGVSIL
jgi:hypothetical protein